MQQINFRKNNPLSAFIAGSSKLYYKSQFNHETATSCPFISQFPGDKFLLTPPKR
jgi:hypothetical protein